MPPRRDAAASPPRRLPRRPASRFAASSPSTTPTPTAPSVLPAVIRGPPLLPCSCLPSPARDHRAHRVVATPVRAPSLLCWLLAARAAHPRPASVPDRTCRAAPRRHRTRAAHRPRWPRPLHRSSSPPCRSRPCPAPPGVRPHSLQQRAHARAPALLLLPLAAALQLPARTR
nr:lysine-rich arabinogalactan protein 19-like [Aegilops tauschii subsp. strangulata]